MNIRAYQHSDETGWLRCRVLSFLDTAYYDNVLTEKEEYTHPVIELVAIIDDQVVGLLDIEYEENEKTVCTIGAGRGGMIWHIAVHPDYRRRGIAQELLREAENQARQLGLAYLEAWTRDDEWVNAWYEQNEFKKKDSYLHVYAESREEVDQWLGETLSEDRPVSLFAHYIGENKDHIMKMYNRVYECNGYVKALD